MKIFLTNPKVVPNARRDGFEDSTAWREVRRDIKELVVKRIIKLVRSASTTRSAMKALSDNLAKLTADAGATTMDQDKKDRVEKEVKRNLQTLGSPEKLVGADPREVSRLTSKFKELAEQLARRVVTVVEVEDTDEEEEDAVNRENGADGGRKDTEDDGDIKVPPVTRRDVVHSALKTELPDAQATRMTDLIIAKLDDYGF